MGTWIVGTFVLFIIGLAIYKIIKDKKAGKGCGGGCGSCQGCPESGCKDTI